jgi:hypothetical protein
MINWQRQFPVSSACHRLSNTETVAVDHRVVKKTRGADSGGSKSKILSVDADFAEAQENAATASGASETELGAETRKQENLIDLMFHRVVTGPGENIVRHHFTGGV